MSTTPSFVFYDPTGRRWNRFRRVIGISGILLVTSCVLFVLSLLSAPELPGLGLPGVQHLANFADVRQIIRGQKTAVNRPFKFQKIKYVRNGGNPVLHPKIAAKPQGTQPLVFGFYVNWDQASIVSLRFNLGHLTHLLPEWLSLQNGKGDLDDETDETVVKIAHDAQLPILVEVNNIRHETWQAGDLHRVMTNKAARANLIDNIYSNIAEHKFAGVNIDLELLPEHDRSAMVEFMRELRAKLHPAGYILTQSVPVDDPAYDLKQLGEINDYVVPMVYDEHYQSSTPGPVASQDWFDNQIDALTKVVPPSKTVMGIGNYGYDWVIGAKGGSDVTFSDVISAAESSKKPITWDENTENPVLRYSGADGDHEIWFLDAVTALNQIQDVAEDGFRGVAVWRLGSEDPGLWKVLAPHEWPGDNFNPVSLFTLVANSSTLQYGGGEILRITDTPHDGKRNVWKDKNKDDDFAEKFGAYPAYYVVESSGATDKKVLSITFDDGPSEYTPEILDVLSQKHVPATFFVIGENAEQYPQFVKREFAEGHTIGNHTYSHPNIANESEDRTKFELSTTLRLIEHLLGHGTKLFRPPYNADSQPTTPQELLPILRAQNMGYITVAESLDPRDWEPGHNADQILGDTLDQVNDTSDDPDNRHLILLHDGGGDRSGTLAALPRIIDELRAQGYQFVPLETLMNETRAQLMPVPSKDEQRWATIEGDALTTKGNLKKFSGLLFLVAIYLTLLRSLVYGALAIAQKFKARKRKFDPDFRPGVSVVIAAYNEDKVIERTVRSVLNNGYPALEVLVVDDGSKDKTLEVMQRAFGAEPRVRIFTQPNRGKAGALNHAIREAKNDILIAVDADTIFRPGTIEKLVRHFNDPSVGAVSGNARVGNRKKWITRFQSIEYICGFNLDRRALDLLNAITVVPGAVGAWRRDLVCQLGGFGDDTLAEDTDLTLSIRRFGYRIRYEEEAVAFTEAPETTRDLAKQRFRWAFGTLQAAWKHRDATFNPQYGYLAFVALPSIWVFQVLLAAVSPFAEVAMIIALFSGNWRIVLLYYFALFLLELATAILAYTLERAKPWDLVLLFVQRIYYRQLMYYVLGKSILYAMRGRLVGWGKLERRATVQGA